MTNAPDLASHLAEVEGFAEHLLVHWNNLTEPQRFQLAQQLYEAFKETKKEFVRNGGVLKPRKFVPLEKDSELEYALQVGRAEGWTNNEPMEVEAEILRLESARRTEQQDIADSD